MKKEVISVFDGETTRKTTLAEKVGASVFGILTIPIILFVLVIVFVYFALVYCGRSCV